MTMRRRERVRKWQGRPQSTGESWNASADSRPQRAIEDAHIAGLRRMAFAVAAQLGVDTDEAISDVFEAFTTSEKFRAATQPGAEPGWLYWSVRQVVWTAHRRRRGRGRIDPRSPLQIQVDSLDEIAAAGYEHLWFTGGADPTGDAAATRADIAREVARMRPERWRVLACHAIGMLDREIAEELGMSRATVTALRAGTVSSPRGPLTRARPAGEEVTERVAAVIAAVARGENQRRACAEVGITVTTFLRYRDRPEWAAARAEQAAKLARVADLIESGRKAGDACAEVGITLGLWRRSGGTKSVVR